MSGGPSLLQINLALPFFGTFALLCGAHNATEAFDTNSTKQKGG
jgi:hypothetical protein